MLLAISMKMNVGSKKRAELLAFRFNVCDIC